MPQKRVRFGAGGNIYDPMAREKKQVRSFLSWQQGVKQPYDEPIIVTFLFVMPIPKYHGKKKRRELIGQPVPVKPDISNLIKFIEDAGNGIVWTDDNRIVRIIADQVYGIAPETKISVVPYV